MNNEPRYVYHIKSSVLLLFYPIFVNGKTKGWSGEDKVAEKYNHQTLQNELNKNLLDKYSKLIDEYMMGEMWVENGYVRWFNNESGFWFDTIGANTNKAKEHWDANYIRLLNKIVDINLVEKTEVWSGPKGGTNQGIRIIYKDESIFNRRFKLRRLK